MQLQNSTLEAFRGLDETGQRAALGRMSDEAKRTLLDQIKSQSAPVQPSQSAPLRQDMNAGEVAKDQVAHQIKGANDLITGAPDAAAGLFGAFKDILTGKGTRKAQEMLTGTARQAGKTIGTVAQGTAALAGNLMNIPVNAPTDQEFQQSAEFAGANAMGIAAGEAIPAVVGAGKSAVAAPKNLFNAAKSKLAAPPLEPSAINRWMNVAAKQVEHGANPGQQLLKENLLGATKEATRSNVKTALQSASRDMETHLEAATKAGKTIDAQTPTYDAIASAKKRIGSPKDVTFQSQLDSILDDIETDFPDLDKLTPTKAHALKKALGDSIDWDGMNMDAPVNQAKIQIYRDLNSKIKAVSPGISAVQDRWGNLYIASKSLKKSMARDIVGAGSGAEAPRTLSMFEKAKTIAKNKVIGAENVKILKDLKQ